MPCPLTCSLSLMGRKSYKPVDKLALAKLCIHRPSLAVVSNLNVMGFAFLVVHSV